MTRNSFDAQTLITQAQQALENASYGATMCAERVTFFKAISEGKRAFIAIAIVGSDGSFAYPCGMCRQVMSEFGLELQVIVASKTEHRIHTLMELLPHAFTSFEPKAA